MSPPAKAEVKWEVTKGFKDSYNKYKAHTPEIKGAMAEFNRHKRQVPPNPLPAKMKDHKLGGPLKGFMDCHLADDVILIYKHQPNGGAKLFLVCEHKDLKGPKAKDLAKRLK